MLIPRKEEFQTFTVIGDMPGFNEMILAAKSFSPKNKKYNGYASLKQKWSNIIEAAILESGLFHIDKLFLHLIWNEPNRKRDPDNIAAFVKFILDALQKANIIDNDGWNNIIGWRNDFIVSPPRSVEVRLYDKTRPNSKTDTEIQEENRQKYQDDQS